MVRSECGLAERQRLLAKFDGLSKAAERSEATAEFAHALKCSRVVRPAMSGVKFTRLFNLVCRDLRITQKSKRPSKCEAQAGFDEGLHTKSVANEWQSGFKGSPKGDPRTQSSLFALGPRGGNPLFFQEVEPGFCFRLAGHGVVSCLRFRPRGKESELLGLSVALGSEQGVAFG